MKTVASRKMKLYGAKILYLNVVSGVAKVGKRVVDKKYNLFEERVILIKAASLDQALKKASKEAKGYEGSFKNPFGQKITTRLLDCIDVYEMFSKAEDLSEIYSSTILVNKKCSIKRMLDLHYGETLNEANEIKIRRKFLNAELSGAFKK